MNNEADTISTTAAAAPENIPIGATPTPADAGGAADDEGDAFQFPPGWDMEAEIRGFLGLARIVMNMAEGANDDYSPQLNYLADRLFDHHKLLNAGWEKLLIDHYTQRGELAAQLAAAKAEKAAPGSESAMKAFDASGRILVAAAEMVVERAREMAPAAAPGDDAAIVEAVAKIKELDERVNRLNAERDELPGGDPRRETFWPPIDELVSQMHALRAELAQMRATTPEAFRAKAWTVRQYAHTEGGEHFNPSEEDAVAWSLAGDLLGLPTQKVQGEGAVP